MLPSPAASPVYRPSTHSRLALPLKPRRQFLSNLIVATVTTLVVLLLLYHIKFDPRPHGVIIATTDARSDTDTITHARSVAADSQYRDCVQSFVNRQHSKNNGVSVRLGVFSTWSAVETRQMLRDTWMRWLPRNHSHFDIHRYCQNPSGSSVRTVSANIDCHLVEPTIGIVELDSSEWLSVYDNIEIYFILGRETGSKNNQMVANLTIEQEIAKYGDIHLLDIGENMDQGKSLHWFRTMAVIHQQRVASADTLTSPSQYGYDYVMKVDSDSFIHLPNLVTKIRTFRQQKLKEVYYGLYYHIPHRVPPVVQPSQMVYYHSGMGYLMSMDLITFFNTDAGLRVVKTAVGVGDVGEQVPDSVRGNNTHGHGTEDIMWGTWIVERGRVLGRHTNTSWSHNSSDNDEVFRLYHALVYNFINAAPNFYYHPLWSHYWALTQFHALTELIHWNKNTQWYQQIIGHFMCQRSLVYDWAGMRQWWKDSVRHPRDVSYHFNSNGSVLPTREWYEDWGQSYRESKVGYQTPDEFHQQHYASS